MRFALGTRRHSTVMLVAAATAAAAVSAAAGAAGAIPILNDPPVARATATPNPAHVGESVTLDGSGSTDEETSAGNLLYSWQFGDGSPATGPSTANFEVPHTYSAAGVYTATLTVTDPQGASDTDQVVINVDDTAPVAAATATPTTAMVQQQVHFDGSGSSDAETADAGLTFAWDFKDGATGTGLTPAHTYTDAGSYPVELTVTDPQGVSDTATVTITVTNTAPTANGTITPAAPHVGDSVTFDATSSADTETPSDLAYDWDFGDGSTHATTATATHSYSSTGARTVKLKVTDPQGLSSTKTFKISVAANGTPTAVASASQAKANVGQSVTLDASASSDPEGTDLSYAWDFGDGGTTEDATGEVTSHAFTAPGRYSITLTVTDGYGLTDTDTTTVQVGNDAPTAALTVNPDPGYALANLAFDGSASTDAETPDQLTYSWLFGDGASTPYSADPHATHAYAGAGTYTVTLRVKDAKGAIGTQTRSLEVRPNAAPVAAATGTPDPVHVGGSVTFDGTGSTDADGDGLTYHWAFPGGASSTTATAHRTFDTVGTFDVTLTVTDSHGATDTDVVTITVVNDAPTARFTTGRATLLAGNPVPFDAARSGDTEDPDGLTYTWDFGDGGTGTGAEPTHSYSSAGSYLVSLTVADPQGLTDTTTRTVYVAAELACQSSPVTSTSHWRTVRSAAATGGSYCDNLSSGTPDGGRMLLTISGPRVGLTFARSSAGGIAQVTIDGVRVGRISFNSTNSRPDFGHQKVFTGLSDGQHTLKIKMLSGVGYLDSFLVYGTTG